MKRRIELLMLAVLVSVFLAMPTQAQAPIPSFGQMTCNGTAAQIYKGGAGNIRGQYYRLIIVPITPGVTVWIAPGSTITTSNAGIPLSTNGISYYLADGNPNQTWYCRTAGSSATVGYTVLF